jgi:hypothetical protein
MIASEWVSREATNTNFIVFALTRSGSSLWSNQWDDDGAHNIVIPVKYYKLFHSRMLRVMVMVFNATFNNISVISWRSVLLEEETEENHRPATSHWQTVTLVCASHSPIISEFDDGLHRNTGSSSSSVSLSERGWALSSSLFSSWVWLSVK